MKYALNLTFIIVFSLSCLVKASDKNNAAQIFNQMKSLVGVGVGERESAKNSSFNVSFELTAADTTLIETWNSALNNISFMYFDATNLESLGHSHQHSLGIEISEPLNEIRRKETYLSKAGEEVSELILVRKSVEQ